MPERQIADIGKVPALEVTGLAKSFGKNRVLHDVSLKAWQGEILALAGENGAGKSTLVEIVAGVHSAGSYLGEVRIHGEPVRFRSVANAEEHGVVIVPQELAIVPSLTVADNVFLNSEPSRWGVIDAKSMRQRSGDLLRAFGLDVDLDVEAGSLGIAQQQIVEIARAMRKEASVLILDEPTAALTVGETELLFARLENLRTEGMCILYISHRLDEILRLADRVVVLRDGRLVDQGKPKDLTGSGIVRAMIGADLAQGRPTLSKRPQARSSRLKITKWTVLTHRGGEAKVSAFDLDLGEGEVVGLLGAVGSGRSELLLSLVGAFGVIEHGTMTLSGEDIRIPSPQVANRHGVAFVPEDRHRMGLVPQMTVQQNLLLSSLDEISRMGVIALTEARLAATRAKTDVHVVAESLDMLVTQLSGGNQQKVVLGRALVTEPGVLLLDEPTRGVDVAAKAEIHRLLRSLAEAGLAVLMASSEAEEILDVADRVLVLRNGRVVLEREVEKTTVEELVAAVTGVLERELA